MMSTHDSSQERHSDVPVSPSEPQIDDILVRELARPGSDQRHGVNLIARPNEALRAYIEHIQHQLASVEPSQYYYPASDLHLTVLELCSGRSEAEASALAAALRPLLADILAQIAPVELRWCSVRCDARACALHYVQETDALAQARAHARELLRQARIAVEPRYPPKSAHLTLMRYIVPPQGPLAPRLAALADLEAAVELPWTIGSLWLTWGATWYSMRQRISIEGPFPLS